MGVEGRDFFRGKSRGFWSPLLKCFTNNFANMKSSLSWTYYVLWCNFYASLCFRYAERVWKFLFVFFFCSADKNCVKFSAQFSVLLFWCWPHSLTHTDSATNRFSLQTFQNNFSVGVCVCVWPHSHTNVCREQEIQDFWWCRRVWWVKEQQVIPPHHRQNIPERQRKPRAFGRLILAHFWGHFADGCCCCLLACGSAKSMLCSPVFWWCRGCITWNCSGRNNDFHE